MAESAAAVAAIMLQTKADTAAAVATTKTVNNDDNDSILEVFEEPTLEPSVHTSFTIDENISLDYQLLLDPDQPFGRRDRFTREDLIKFIPTTEHKYCLVVSKPSYFQLLHSAIMWGNWVYASTSGSGVDDYWMRISVKSLVVLMKILAFGLW